jgi:hypothetical protein
VVVEFELMATALGEVPRSSSGRRPSRVATAPKWFTATTVGPSPPRRPAAATSPSSTPPVAALTPSTIAARPSGSDRSATTSASRTSTPTTWWPSRSSRSRVAAPMPPAEPVMAIVATGPPCAGVGAT